MAWKDEHIHQMYLRGDFREKASFVGSPEAYQVHWEAIPGMVESVREDLKADWPLSIPCPDFKILEVILKHGDGDDPNPFHGWYCQVCHGRALQELQEWAAHWV